MELVKAKCLGPLCATRDAKGECVVVEVQSEIYGLFRVKVYASSFPVKFLPYVRNRVIDVVYSDVEEAGIMLGLDNQSSAITGTIINLGLKHFSSEKIEGLPFVTDPWAAPLEHPETCLSAEDAAALGVVTDEELERLIQEIESQDPPDDDDEEPPF